MLASALASLSVTHLRMSSRGEKGLAAANAARSAVSKAISTILQDPDYGQGRASGDLINVEARNATGILTFHPETARQEGLPFSTNNLDHTEASEGAGGLLVPASTVHLVGVGRCEGVERRVVAVLRLPPFPWAIASGGIVETRNGVLIASLPVGVWPPPSDDSQLLPADLLANGRGEAVNLSSGSVVLGDIETPGRVVTAPGVSVRGEIRAGSEPAELPALHPSDYDPAARGADYFQLSGREDELVGSARGQGAVTFAQALTLTNAHIFVDGQLRLAGGVRGSGTLVATGDIVIEGAANLDGLTELAVVSGGRVRLSGGGRARSYLKGLFYAEQGLEAREMTLVGALLTGRASTGVSLDQVNVFYQPPGVLSMGPASSRTTLQVVGNVAAASSPTGDYTRLTGVQCQTLGPDQSPAPTTGSGPLRLFSVDIGTSAGDYPLQVTLSPGYVAVAAQSTTLNSAEELQAFLDGLADELARPAVVGPYLQPGQELFDSPILFSLVSALEDGLQRQFAGGEPGDAPPAPGLSTDISRFLPIEDRIRIVSWDER